MEKLFAKIQANKKSLVGFGVMLLIMMIATSAGATVAPAADAETVSSVSHGMSGIQATALAVVAAVAGTAVLLFAAPFAWQYGKKIFKTVAR